MCRERREVDQHRREGEALQAGVPVAEVALAEADAEDVAIERGVACGDDEHQGELGLRCEVRVLGAVIVGAPIRGRWRIEAATKAWRRG